MKYKIHRFEINMNEDQAKLEEFINRLRGEVVAIIPNVKPTFMLMGATAKVNFLFIVEKFKWNSLEVLTLYSYLVGKALQ